MERARLVEQSPDPFHLEALAWMIGQLEVEDRREFGTEVAPYLSELSAIVNAMEKDPAKVDRDRLQSMLNDLSAIIRDWQASVMLAHDPAWVASVRESEVAWAGGTGEFTTVKELREALTS